MKSTTRITLHKTTKISGGVEVEYVRAIETRGFSITGKAMMPTGLDAKTLASLREGHQGQHHLEIKNDRR